MASTMALCGSLRYVTCSSDLLLVTQLVGDAHVCKSRQPTIQALSWTALFQCDIEVIDHNFKYCNALYRCRPSDIPLKPLART